jgi:hypothetical protein
VKIYGPPPLGAKGDLQASLCTFNVEGIDAIDLLTSLDQQLRSICFVDCVIKVFFKAIITHFWENLEILIIFGLVRPVQHVIAIQPGHDCTQLLHHT